MLKKIKFALWVVTFAAGSVASLSVIWSLVSGGLADAISLFDLEDVAVVVACLVLVGPVGFTALSLERITGDREFSASVRALKDFLSTPEWTLRMSHEGTPTSDRDPEGSGSRAKDGSGGDGVT